MGSRPPTRPCGDTDSMQVVAFVPTSSAVAILTCNRMDGVFTREHHESDMDRDRYKIIPLPLISEIESAQRHATWMADIATGIVNTRRIVSCVMRRVSSSYRVSRRVIFRVINLINNTYIVFTNTQMFLIFRCRHLIRLYIASLIPRPPLPFSAVRSSACHPAVVAFFFYAAFRSSL